VEAVGVVVEPEKASGGVLLASRVEVESAVASGSVLVAGGIAEERLGSERRVATARLRKIYERVRAASGVAVRAA